jgi:hypothetical protein
VNWWLALVTVGPAAVLVADRLLLAAEARGWIYYRRRRPPTGTLSSGVLTVMSIYQPGHAHIVDGRREAAIAVDEIDDDDPFDYPPHAPSGPRIVSAVDRRWRRRNLE